jgi:hypothetical protein
MGKALLRHVLGLALEQPLPMFLGIETIAAALAR